MVLPISGLRFIYRAMRSRFELLFAFFTLPIIVSILGCGGGGNDQPAATSARYVPEIHLFALEEFKYRSYNVGTVVNTPILASVAVRGDEPWELGGLGYASVVDDGTVKLVYTCDDADHIRRLCVAVSPDAISFHKPAVKQVNFGDNNDNNILPVSLTDGGCTFKLYDSGYGIIGADYDLPSGTFQQRIYGSDDNFRFHLVNDHIFEYSSDSLNVIFYDRVYNKYVAYLRSWNHIANLPGTDKYFRTVSRLEIEDPFSSWRIPGIRTPFHNPQWPASFPSAISSELPIVFAPDNDDPANTHIYAPAVNQYRASVNSYVAFPSIYHHLPDPPDGGAQWNDGTVDLQLAISSDGMNFTRFRTPYIDHRFFPTDVKQMYAAPGLVVRGDAIYQYVLTLDNSHADVAANTKVYTLKQRIDGFVSLDNNDYNQGELVTSQMWPGDGRNIALNFRTEPGGYIQVELIDDKGDVIPGFGRHDMKELSGDSVDATVSWGHGGEVIQGGRFRARFIFMRAKLYSFKI